VVASAVAALYILNLPAVVVQIVSARYTSIAAGRAKLGSIPRVLVQVSGIGLALGLAMSAVLLLASGPLAGYLQISDRRVIVTLAFASLTAMLVAATRGALQGLRRFVALSINNVLDASTRVVSAAGMILIGLGALGGVIALMVGPLIAYAESLFLFGGLRGKDADAPTPLSQVSRYAALTAVGAIGTTYLYNVDVVLSKHYLAAEAAGIYAAASILGRVVYFLGLTIAQVMFPEVATLHAKDEPHYHVVDLSLALIGIVAVGLTVVYAAVPGIVLLPFGGAFSPVRAYLWPFAIALGLLSIINLLINYFLSVGSARFSAPLAGACLLETVLIALFHSSPGQVLGMVLITMSLLAAVLGSMYVVERLTASAGLRKAN